MSDIANAIAAAKSAAASSAPVPAVMPAPGVPAAARTATVTDFLNNTSTAVDAFLKVTENGMTVGQKTELVESFDAVIDFSELAYPLQIRYGNPVQFKKSYDGGVTVKGGGSWSDALALAKRMEPGRGSDPYQTVDIVMHCVGDVKAFKGKTETIVAEDEDVLGFSPSYTGVQEFKSLCADVEKAGGNLQNAVVSVKVGFQPKTNNRGNKWAVVTFEFKELLG